MTDQPRVIAILASYEPAQRTYDSLARQTVSPSRIVIADKRIPHRSIGVRVSRAINASLRGVDLSSFDWLLRVDGDTVLQPAWMERSLEAGADIVGYAGYALLIRMKAFLAAGGAFPEIEKEDSLLIFKMRSLGFTQSPYVVRPVLLRDPGKGTDQSWYSYVEGGFNMWKCGNEPLHFLHSCVSGAVIRTNPKFLLAVFGYFLSAARGTPTWDPKVTRWVRAYQFSSLARNLESRL